MHMILSWLHDASQFSISYFRIYLHLLASLLLWTTSCLLVPHFFISFEMARQKLGAPKSKIISFIIKDDSKRCISMCTLCLAFTECQTEFSSSKSSTHFNTQEPAWSGHLARKRAPYRSTSCLIRMLTLSFFPRDLYVDFQLSIIFLCTWYCQGNYLLLSHVQDGIMFGHFHSTWIRGAFDIAVKCISRCDPLFRWLLS